MRHLYLRPNNKVVHVTQHSLTGLSKHSIYRLKTSKLKKMNIGRSLEPMIPEAPNEETTGKVSSSPAHSPQDETEGGAESPARHSEDISDNAEVLAEPRVVAVDVADEEGAPARCEHFASVSMTALALLAAFLISAVYVTLRSLSVDNVDVTLDDLDTEPRGQFLRLAEANPAVIALSSYKERQTDLNISIEGNETTVYNSSNKDTDDAINVTILISKIAAVGNDDQILPINAATTLRSSLKRPYIHRRTRFRITRRMSRRIIYRAAFLNISQFTKPALNIQLVVKEERTSSTGFRQQNVARRDDYSDYSVIGARMAEDVRKSANSRSTRNRRIIYKGNAPHTKRHKNEDQPTVNIAPDSRRSARRKKLKEGSKHYKHTSVKELAASLDDTPTESEESAFQAANAASIQTGKHDLRVVDEILNVVRNRNRSQQIKLTGMVIGPHQRDAERAQARDARTVACETELCHRPGARLVPSTMDVTVDPCDDFHKHVCGGGQECSGNPFLQMRTEAMNSLRAVLESQSVPEGDHTAIHKAVNMFRACVRFPTDGLALELPRIRRFLASIGMNLTAAAKDRVEVTTENPMLPMLRLSLQYALHTFVAFVVDGLHAVNGKKILRVLVSNSDKEWLKDRAMLSEQEKKDYYAGVLLVYEEKPLLPEIVMLIPDIANFESQASRKLKSQDRISNSRQEGLFFNLEELAAYVNWYQPPDQWHAVLQRTSLLAYGVNDTAHATSAGLALLKLVTSPEQRSKAKQLMTWSLIRQLVGFGRNALLVTHSVSELKDRCIRKVSEVMGSALQGLLLLKTFTPQVIAQMETISGMLLNATAGHLKQKQPRFSSPLPDEATWLEALGRLAAVDVVVGFPDRVRTESDLEEIYGGFPEANGIFWETWILSAGIAQKRILKGVATPDVQFPVASAVASYTPSLNKLVVPAGVARPPVFMNNAPLVYHYGTVGMIIARAIMRDGCAADAPGLDDAARGSENWRAAVALSFYIRASKCSKYDPQTPFMDYAYSAASLLGDPELIAEVAATSASYEAFRRLPVSAKNDFLTALPYTAEQLFFVANCAMRCCDPEKFRSDLTYDSDSFCEDTARLRVTSYQCNSIVKRIPEFSTAFNCPVGSKMNPSDRCTS